MRVSVRLHGILRRHHPGPDPHAPHEVEVAEHSVVRDLVSALGLPDDLILAASVNGEASEPDRPLNEGDRVSLFPPVAGGRQAKGEA